MLFLCPKLFSVIRKTWLVLQENTFRFSILGFSTQTWDPYNLPLVNIQYILTTHTCMEFNVNFNLNLWVVSN